MKKFTNNNGQGWTVGMSGYVSCDCPHCFIYPEGVNVKQTDEDAHLALVNCDYEEADANIRLIAAAPEMYDELYETLQLLEGVSSYEGDMFDEQAASIRELMARIDGEVGHDG